MALNIHTTGACATRKVKHRHQKLQPDVLKCHLSPAEELAPVIGWNTELDVLQFDIPAFMFSKI